MITAILVTLLIGVAVFELVLGRKARKYGNRIPGPRRLPILGNALMLTGDGEDLLKALSGCRKKYGQVYRVFLGNELFVVLSGAKEVKTLMGSTTHISKSDEYRFLRPFLSTGLITSGGSRWKRHRKIIKPAFHSDLLQNFLPILEKHTDSLVKLLSQHAGNGKFDVHDPVTLCALDTICETIMGVSLNVQESGSEGYTGALKTILSICQMRMKHPVYRFDAVFNLTKYSQRLNSALNHIQNFTKSVIEKRRKWLETDENGIKENNDYEDSGSKRRQVLLDTLITSSSDGVKLTDEEILAEVAAFMFAGHDTITSALCFSLYLIAEEEKVQKQLYEEQLKIFGDDLFKAATSADLQEMKYLEAVIKETLRLYPSVPLIGRKLDVDATINELELPTDTRILVDLYHLHRDPEMFPDPEKFIPERYLQEDSAKINAYAIPFASGLRNCIGQQFAMMEVKMFLSKILRNYKLTSVNVDLQISTSLIISSVNGYNVKIDKR